MVKIIRSLSHEYVCCLPKELESTIKVELEKELSKIRLTEEEYQDALENGLNSKVCDLTDTITIQFI